MVMVHAQLMPNAFASQVLHESSNWSAHEFLHALQVSEIMFELDC